MAWLKLANGWCFTILGPAVDDNMMLRELGVGEPQRIPDLAIMVLLLLDKKLLGENRRDL
jgi:hypothetical protein